MSISFEKYVIYENRYKKEKGALLDVLDIHLSPTLKPNINLREL